MIFVTGATGTVGAEAVKALRAKSKQVKAGSRNPDAAEKALGITALAWNWDEPQNFASALTGIDALLLITPPGTTKDAEYGLAAVAAAKAAGVKKIVKLSAIGAERDPQNPHRIVELAIEASGMAWTFLRPSFFMQNLAEGSADGIKHGGAIYLPAGNGKTGMIDARDIGAVAAEALTRTDLEAHGLTLTGSEALTYAEMAAMISSATSKPVTHVDLSPEDFKAALLKAGVPEHYADFLNVLMGFVKAGYTGQVNDEVKAVLGREPIKFAQFAKDYAKVWA